MRRGIEEVGRAGNSATPNMDKIVANYEKFQRRIDPIAAAHRRMAAEMARDLAMINDMVRIGQLTEQQAARDIAALRQQQIAQIERVKAATDRQTVSLRANTQAMNDNRRATVSSFHSTNLLFQMQDIAMMTAMGQAPHILAMQQGTQVAGIFHQIGNGRQVVDALKGAIVGLLNPLSLATVGIIGVGAAAVQYFTSAKDGADNAKEALERHAALLKEIEKGYGLVADKIKAVSFETSTMMTFMSARSEAELEFAMSEATSKYRAPTFFSNLWDKTPPVGERRGTI